MPAECMFTNGSSESNLAHFVGSFKEVVDHDDARHEIVHSVQRAPCRSTFGPATIGMRY